MNVSKSSWHYNLYTSFYKARDDEDYPTNLCTYFWKVMFALAFKFIIFPFLIVLGALTCGLMVWGLLILPHTVFGGVLSYIWPSHFNPPGQGMWEDLGTLQLWLTDLVFYLAVALFLWVRGKIKNRKRKPYSTRKEDSLVVAWVKAKKNKVCPLVEYKD